MKFLKRVLRFAVIGLSFLIIFILASNLWVVLSTRSKVLDDQQQLKKGGVALVLGTSHRMISGVPNPFFENRIFTAAELYRNGKVSHFILSGDNRTRYYNEPLEMKKALMKQGVPSSSITLDHAGLRTLDSIVRCKEIFGQSNIIIITQPFHSYRALFISNYYQIDAVALVAQEPSQEISAQVYFREYFARTKAILDLYILGTEPLHLGEKEPLSL
jgi:SanA protein